MRIANRQESRCAIWATIGSEMKVYFSVADVDVASSKALEAGGREMLPPQDFPGGRLAIVGDP